MDRFFPTSKQLVHATMLALGSHPKIKQPGIYYPVTPLNGIPQEILIDNWRDYDGINIENGGNGITCDVFPYYSTRTFNSGFRSRSGGRSAAFRPVNIGSHGSQGAYYEGIYHLVVQLQYQDTAIGESITLTGDQLQSALFPSFLTTPHGENITYTDESVLAVPDQTKDNPVFTFNNNQDFSYVQRNTLNININPGENILREYMDLMRLALDDIPKLLPFNVRSTQVLEIDYPTTSWNRENTDIYFHYAWLLWEISLYVPSNWRDLYFSDTTHINIDLDDSPEI